MENGTVRPSRYLFERFVRYCSLEYETSRREPRYTIRERLENRYEAYREKAEEADRVRNWPHQAQQAIEAWGEQIEDVIGKSAELSVNSSGILEMRDDAGVIIGKFRQIP